MSANGIRMMNLHLFGTSILFSDMIGIYQDAIMDTFFVK